jgi:hypothetical protein
MNMYRKAVPFSPHSLLESLETRTLFHEGFARESTSSLLAALTPVGYIADAGRVMASAAAA